MYQLSSASGQSGTDPARHLAEQIRRQRTVVAVVQASASSKSYMAHSENIMLAMLGDENPSVRADAVELIHDMRWHPFLVTPCSFRKPKLNFEAEHYTELTDLRATKASSPTTWPWTVFKDLKHFSRSTLVFRVRQASIREKTQGPSRRSRCNRPSV